MARRINGILSFASGQLKLLNSILIRGVGMIFFMGGPNSNFFGASRHSLNGSPQAGKN